MTDLERYEPNGSVAVPTDPTGGRLVAWASGLQAAHQLASALCQTTFVPKHFRGAPEEAAAAILFGDELGLSPTNALRSVYVISGTPSLYARTMVALVLSHGHEIWTEQDTSTSVTVCGRRRGSGHVEKVTWTHERARKAGYTNNSKYQSDAQSMLFARASGDVARRIAPDVLSGIAYSVEEIELQDQPASTVQRAAAKEKPLVKRIAQRAPLPPEPSLDPPQTDAGAEATPAAQPAPTVDPSPIPATDEAEPAPASPPLINEAQMKKMHVLFGKLGITDREERIGITRSVIDREIASSKELTLDEASRLIDALERTVRKEEEGGGE